MQLNELENEQRYEMALSSIIAYLEHMASVHGSGIVFDAVKKMKL